MRFSEGLFIDTEKTLGELKVAALRRENYAQDEEGNVTDEITKRKGDKLMSGSFIVSGQCHARLDKVGEDSYISKLTLQAKAMQSKEQSEMIRSLDKLVKCVGVAIIPIGIVLFSQAFFIQHDGFRESVTSMIAAVIGMIPEGLYLLASVALAVSSIRLAQKKVLLHDMKCIETLARVDVLCVDKTGTITENTMKVQKLIKTDEYDEKEKGGLSLLVGDFAAAMTNPFSVGIAQTIADVPLNSSVAYRAVIFAVFEMVSIWYVMRYARKVKQNPELSVLYGCDEVEQSDKKQYDKEVNFTFRRKLCTILFFATIGILLYGTSMLGWYIDEISSLFLAMMVVAGGSSLNEICLTFIESTKSVVSSILVIGFTRGILIVMKEALISDTIVYYLSSLLDIGNPVISAIGMLFLQSIINIFINGSSSQATITMPIIAPVADIVGVSRQTAVLAYCFGDGFSDMFWPTNCSLECGLMGIPLERWYKFITPLFGILFIMEFVFMTAAVMIGY